MMPRSGVKRRGTPHESARSQTPVRLGIDLGGTKTEIVALDASGREALRRRIPTPTRDYAATLAAVAALVGDAERDLGAAASVAR